MEGRGGREVGPGADGGEGPETDTRDAASARLLVAYDAPTNQVLIAELLKRRGYAADVVPDGAAAVEAASQTPYAAVFMDIQMPRMDGHEATREIRRREPSKRRTPIIAITANTQVHDRERAISAGMDDCLPKPVRPEQLDRVLDRWVSPTPHRRPRLPASAEAPLDPAVLADLRTIQREGGGAIVTALAEAFARETPPLLETLQETVAKDDVPAFKRTAHTLNGIARGVGARRVASTCLELENLADSGDLREAPPLLAHLTHEWKHATDLLATELSSY